MSTYAVHGAPVRREPCAWATPLVRWLHRPAETVRTIRPASHAVPAAQRARASGPAIVRPYPVQRTVHLAVALTAAHHAASQPDASAAGLAHASISSQRTRVPGPAAHALVLVLVGIRGPGCAARRMTATPHRPPVPRAGRLPRRKWSQATTARMGARQACRWGLSDTLADDSRGRGQRRVRVRPGL
ncbi:hypothetical protein BC628DRAFT_1180400 [Trametes gibbosa]|nr:hypothetical protein BC628DRAFT_1180400 [Trametes gibbosa]